MYDLYSLNITSSYLVYKVVHHHYSFNPLHLFTPSEICTMFMHDDFFLKETER